MKLFNLDSPVMRALSRMADLLILNFFALICCIPIVTAGASFTAMHYMCLKMARNEETYVVRGFFKSFKDNFKQATIIWLMCLVVFALLAGDFYLLMVIPNLHMVLRVIIFVTAIVVCCAATFVFPVLAKFDNTVKQTIKNAFLISVIQFPKTVVMFIMNWLPWVLMFSVIQIAPLCIFFGLSAPAFASAYLYNGFFKKMEDQIMEVNAPASDAPEEQESSGEEDERIFHDELDSSILNNNNIN